MYVVEDEGEEVMRDTSAELLAEGEGLHVDHHHVLQCGMEVRA